MPQAAPLTFSPDPSVRAVPIGDPQKPDHHFALISLSDLRRRTFVSKDELMTASRTMQGNRQPHMAFRFYPEARIWAQFVNG